MIMSASCSCNSCVSCAGLANTLHLTFTQTGGANCAALNGISFPITWNGVDRWLLPMANIISAGCPGNFNLIVGCPNPSGPCGTSGCSSMFLTSDGYFVGGVKCPSVGCTCAPLNVVYPNLQINVAQCGCPNTTFTVTVTA